MDLQQFKRILLAFADDPTKVIIEKGEVAAELLGQTVAAHLRSEAGVLHVIEDDVSTPATTWITRRVAQLPMLAHRILDYIPAPPHFIDPRATLDGFLERTTSLEPTSVPKACETVLAQLRDQPAGMSSVLYLTSDAGEGKTTLINQVARDLAARYISGESTWLLLPVSLGGRPFLRFDDVIVASLVNQLRFPRLYFEAFVELVRLGSLVPALDGFEEVFVETPEGEGVSSLATLLRQLGGDGRLLIAARKAYFEYRSLETQAKLLDALRDVNVTFAKLELKRWGKNEFLQYASSRDIEDADSLYNDVSTRVGADHPLLTRAVLVRRLLDVASDKHARLSFVSELQPDTQAFFSRFINTIIEREVREKWLDKGGEAARPLLTIEEHHELLGMLAEEMWVGKSAALPPSLCDSVAEVFCDHKAKPPAISRQIQERLKQHALIVKAPSNRDGYAFDHDHFREFFLGEQLGKVICTSNRAECKRLLRVESLPVWVLEVAQGCVRAAKRATTAVKMLEELAPSEGPTSFLRENSGALAIGLIADAEGRAILTGHLFPPHALSRSRLKDCEFVNCHFRPSALDPANAVDVRFTGCTLERLDIDRQARFDRVSIDANTAIHCLAVRTAPEEEFEIYDPDTIRAELASHGVSAPTPSKPLHSNIETIIEDELRVVMKIVNTFRRATQVNEGTVRLRLSLHAHLFFSRVHKDLEDCGVLFAIPHRGSGVQRHWRLGRQLEEISRAVAASSGKYATFLKIIQQRE